MYARHMQKLKHKKPTMKQAGGIFGDRVGFSGLAVVILAIWILFVVVAGITVWTAADIVLSRFAV